MNLLQLLITLKPVSIGSLPHILPICFALLLGIGLIRYSNLYLEKKRQHQVFFYLGSLISLTVITFHIYKISLGSYNFHTDLPLFLCSFMALIIPVFTYYRRFWMFEILLFWIIAGTTQGIITPDISEGFPSFDFYRYWTVHLGLVIVIFYAVYVLKMRPTLKSAIKSFVALQIYVIVMLFLNLVLNSNYFYLNRKPSNPSALDYFHEWPYYLLEAELVIIPYFLLIYFIFKTKKKTV